MSDRDKWDAIYGQERPLPGRADRVLRENLHLLPASGAALEIACGLAGNAVELARRGLRTDAWDLSPVAMERVAAFARSQGLPLNCLARDVMAAPPPAASYDVIVIAHFLERDLVPHIIAALRPGGVLFYQTFTRTRVTDTGPSNPAFRLADNELLRLFAGLRTLVYREEGRVGDLSAGLRDEAMLVAIKDEDQGKRTKN